VTAESSSSAPARPAPLLVGAGITALEGAALAAGGLYIMVSGFLGDQARLGFAEFSGAILLVIGLFALLAGRALLRGRKWGRSPAVLTNSICLPVAYYMWQSGGLTAALGIAVGLLGLAGIVSVLNPKVTAVLYGS
jgi:hypothetical protein